MKINNFYTKNNFLGKIYKDKKGNNWELNYDDKGRITSSYKNGSKYKTYEYDNASSKDIIYDFGDHKFKDGSMLSNRGYYSIKNENVEKSIIYCNGELFFVLKNKKPMYQKEPVYSVTKVFDNGEETTKLTLNKEEEGIEKIEFNTLDEAKDYFLKEYGIDANFPSLNLAYLTKEALDDYKKLNYQNKGKKLFEGLRIDYKKFGNKTDIASSNIKFKYSDAYKNFRCNTINELLEFSFKQKEKLVDFKNATIYLNTDYDWENYELQEASENYYRPHSTDSAKHAFLHEFAHCLHAIENPILNFVSEYIIPTPEQIPILREVSERSCKNFYEFTAEYIAGKLDGNNYSRQVDDLFKQNFGMHFEKIN